MTESKGVWLLAARRLGLALTVFAIPPTIFLFGYLSAFGAPSSAVLPHILALGSICAGLAGLRVGLIAIPLAATPRRLIAATLLACVSLAMLSFYLLVFVGLQYWGRVTSTQIVGTYLNQAIELLRILGYSTWLAAFVLLAIVGTAWLGAYRFLHRYDWVAPLDRTLSRSAAGLIGLLLLAIAASSASELPYRDWGSRGEPISLSLYSERGETAVQSHAIDHLRASRLDAAEDVARTSYEAATSPKRSNVIVIVADALRADHLSLLGYPRKTSPKLDSLAEEGKVRLATSAVTVCNESSCGLRALASSRYVDMQATRPMTLQSVLRRHGYRVHMVLSGDHTGFYGLREAYGQVDSYFDGSSQKARYVNDDRLVLDRLRAMGPWDGLPVMLQIHLMSSHALGKRFDETPVFGRTENYQRLVWRGIDPEVQQSAVNFYDQGVLQADSVISEILKSLESGGYLRDALVVITGDHGEALGERDRYGHAQSVWEESLRVPFVLLSFGAANPGLLNERPVTSQVDVAPTLLWALDIPIPSTWEGRPLQLKSNTPIVFFQQAQYIGLIDARTDGKLYKHWNDVGKGEWFTFELLADPRETENLTLKVSESLRSEWQRLLLNRAAAVVPDGAERREGILIRSMGAGPTTQNTR